MKILDQKTGCCGASFEKNNISFVGLLTFSFPMLIISSAVWGILKLTPFYRLSEKSVLFVIIKSNLELIQKKSIMAKWKCLISARLFSFSPRLSGFLFKYFNLLLFLFLWILPLNVFIYMRQV